MKQRKTILILMLLLSIFILSACGVESDDRMTIDKNFNGQRVISLKVDKDNNRYIKGGLVGLGKFLRDQVSQPFELSIITETEELLEAKLSLSFQGLEDYRNKVLSLYQMGQISEIPDLEFTSDSKNIFMHGMKYKDDITSSKLLKHLIDRAVESGLIKKDHKNQILKENSFSLNFEGQNLINGQTQTPYTVDNFTYIGPSQYIIATSPVSDGKWTRVFTAVFPKENFEKINFDWESKLVQTPNITKLDSQEVNDNNGKHSFLFKYILKDKDLESIQNATSNFLQASDSLDLSIVPNEKTFQIEYILKEKIDGLDLGNGVKTSAVYYLKPTKDKMHFPIGNSYLNELESINEAIVAHERDLAMGYSDKKVIKPIFQEANIRTSFEVFNNQEDKYQINKEIEIIKGKDFYADLGAKLITEELSKKEIQVLDEKSKLTIKYGGKNFKKDNLLIFDQNPSIDSKGSNLFSYKLNYSDESSFKGFNVEKVNQVFAGPRLSNIREEKVIFTGDRLSNQLNISGPIVMNIVLSALVALAIFAGLYLVIKAMNKDRISLKDFEEKKEPKPVAERITKERDLSDTQPIPVINEEEINDGGDHD